MNTENATPCPRCGMITVNKYCLRCGFLVRIPRDEIPAVPGLYPGLIKLLLACVACWALPTVVVSCGYLHHDVILFYPFFDFDLDRMVFSIFPYTCFPIPFIGFELLFFFPVMYFRTILFPTDFFTIDATWSLILVLLQRKGKLQPATLLRGLKAYGTGRIIINVVFTIIAFISIVEYDIHHGIACHPVFCFLPQMVTTVLAAIIVAKARREAKHFLA